MEGSRLEKVEGPRLEKESYTETLLMNKLKDERIDIFPYYYY